MLYSVGKAGKPFYPDFHSQHYHCGGYKVQGQQKRGRPQGDHPYRVGNEGKKSAQETVGKQHGHHGKSAPEQGIAQADISADVEPDAGVIPELFIEDFFHQHSCGVFQQRCQYHSAQEQEEQIARELR